MTTDHKDDIPLLPCPFCGADGIYPEDREPIGELYCQCSDDACRTFGPSGHTWDEAAERWNQRKDNVCSPELVGGMCRRIETLETTEALAIDILDGNAAPIDWRDDEQPELLRKLCEHLEST